MRPLSRHPSQTLMTCQICLCLNTMVNAMVLICVKHTKSKDCKHISRGKIGKVLFCKYVKDTQFLGIYINKLMG